MKFLLISKNQICLILKILGYRIGEERFVDDFRGEIDFFLNFNRHRVSTFLTIHSTRNSFCIAQKIILGANRSNASESSEHQLDILIIRSIRYY
jgi:hypothetical protein